MQTFALALGCLKRAMRSGWEWSNARQSELCATTCATHMPFVVSSGSATQNVVGLGALSEQYCVQRAEQKPRSEYGFAWQKPLAKAQSASVEHSAPIQAGATSTRVPSARRSGSRWACTG